MKICENTNFKIVMGAFNDNIGNHNDDSIPQWGNFGLGLEQSREETRINFLPDEKMYLMNTFLKKSNQIRCIWKSSDWKTKNEINHMMSNKNKLS